MPRKPGPNSWQNDPDRSKTSSFLRKKDEDYLKHPKNKAGDNICYAWMVKKKQHCQSPAGKGTDHEGYGKCSFHGGNTPVLRTSAARHMGGEVIDRMTKAYGYGIPLDLSPTEALLQEVRRTGGHVAWLAERINVWEMDDKEFISPVRAQWIELYHKERQHLMKVAKTALDAGVNERKIQLAEKQGALMIEAFHKVFDALGLTVAQRRLIPSIMPNVLRGMIEDQPMQIEAERVDRA